MLQYLTIIFKWCMQNVHMHDCESGHVYRCVCFLSVTFTWVDIMTTCVCSGLHSCVLRCPYAASSRQSLCVSGCMCFESTHTHICCRQSPFCAVSLGSCLKQTSGVHCVPNWHAPWDNEKLCIGLDCWLRIIQQHKQATVQPWVHI